MAASVVGAIAPKLQQAEIERAKRKPTDDSHPTTTILRGMACTHHMTGEATTKPGNCSTSPIDRDPDFALAHGEAAYCYVFTKSRLDGRSRGRGRRGCEAGLAGDGLDRDDAVALSFGGHALGYVVGDLDGAVALIDRALVLNSNSAVGWYASGTVRAFRGGEPDVAIEHLKRAMRLSPFDPFMFTMQGVTAFAHFFAGRYDEAVAWAERAFWERPNILATLRIAAASYALAGRAEEAQKAVARALELDPGMRVSNLKERIGWFGRPEDFAKYADALRKAGLPE